MPRLAKTMPSNLASAWKMPSAVQPRNSPFGIPVPPTLRQYGLEEFNLTCFYRKHKIAFIPCMRAGNWNVEDGQTMHLFMYNAQAQENLHYATLEGVETINANQAFWANLFRDNIDCIFQDFSNAVIAGNSLWNAAEFAWIQADYLGRLGAPIVAPQQSPSFPITCTYERLYLADPNPVGNANPFEFGGLMANVCFHNFPKLAPLPLAPEVEDCCRHFRE